MARASSASSVVKKVTVSRVAAAVPATVDELEDEELEEDEELGEIAEALEEAHQNGIIHRDLKPENILITDANEIRIMDLGVAKLQEASTVLTQEGGFAGSLQYAAPEQFEDAVVGPATDQYGLGAVFYELLCGETTNRSEPGGLAPSSGPHVGPGAIRCWRS